MAVCCCALAGTSACNHCSQNPFATDIWTNINTITTCPPTTPPAVSNAQHAVEGEWIPTGAGNLTSRCSICGYKSLEKGNFCHNCGVPMKREN